MKTAIAFLCLVLATPGVAQLTTTPIWEHADFSEFDSPEIENEIEASFPGMGDEFADEDVYQGIYVYSAGAGRVVLEYFKGMQHGEEAYLCVFVQGRDGQWRRTYKKKIGGFMTNTNEWLGAAGVDTEFDKRRFVIVAGPDGVSYRYQYRYDFPLFRDVRLNFAGNRLVVVSSRPSPLSTPDIVIQYCRRHSYRRDGWTVTPELEYQSRGNVVGDSLGDLVALLRYSVPNSNAYDLEVVVWRGTPAGYVFACHRMGLPGIGVTSLGPAIDDMGIVGTIIRLSVSAPPGTAPLMQLRVVGRKIVLVH